MDTNRSEQGQLIEAEQQRQEDVRLESALGAGCCPECGGAGGHHFPVAWYIGDTRFETACPLA